MPAPHFRNALPMQSMLLEYRIEQVLGAGGFGITYRARDTNLDKARRDQGVPARRARDARGATATSCAQATRARGRLRVGPRALPPGGAHARRVRPPEHRARAALLRGQRHRLHRDGLRGGRAARDRAAARRRSRPRRSSKACSRRCSTASRRCTPRASSTATSSPTTSSSAPTARRC